MAGNNINKVVYGSTVLIDLTSDTLTSADQLHYGIVAHDRSGAVITGTNTYDANTSDADAAASEILLNKTAYVNGNKITGSMPNRGAVTGSITTKAQEYTIQAGYHDGSGKVSISSTEQAKIIATNIRQGVTILGVEGSMSGSESVKATSLSVTPYTTSQSYVPADLGDYNSITQVDIAAISYVETSNSYGITATIGTVAPAG